MLTTGESVIVFSFYLEPISINSVFVILSMRLLTISHLLIFSKSSFKQRGFKIQDLSRYLSFFNLLGEINLSYMISLTVDISGPQ